MTQPGSIFVQDASQQMDVPLRSKTRTKCTKQATTGTHHLLGDSSSALIHEENMPHHKMNDKTKLQGKSHKDCVYNIMNNIVQRRKTKQRIYFSHADNHSFGKLFPLKKKANVKDKQDAWQGFTCE